jgi:hypothetical protein
MESKLKNLDHVKVIHISGDLNATTSADAESKNPTFNHGWQQIAESSIWNI